MAANEAFGDVLQRGAFIQHPNPESQPFFVWGAVECSFIQAVGLASVAFNIEGDRLVIEFDPVVVTVKKLLFPVRADNDQF